MPFAPTEEEAEAYSQQHIYEVKPGDTLSDIADFFGTSVEEFVSQNKIDNPNRIFPGQQFAIPGRAPPPTPEPPAEEIFNIPPEGMIMATQGEKPDKAEEPQPNPAITVISEEQFQQLQEPTEVEGLELDETTSKKVTDFFMWLHENVAPDKVLGTVNMLGLAMGVRLGGQAPIVVNRPITSPPPGTKSVSRNMTSAQMEKADQRATEALGAGEVPLPTERMQKKLEAALRARKGSKIDWTESLEWRGAQRPSPRNERTPGREFKDIDQSRIPQGRREPNIDASSEPMFSSLKERISEFKKTMDVLQGAKKRPGLNKDSDMLAPKIRAVEQTILAAEKQFRELEKTVTEVAKGTTATKTSR